MLSNLGPRPQGEGPESASPLYTTPSRVAQALSAELAGWEESSCVQPDPCSLEHPHQGNRGWALFPPFPPERPTVLGNLVLP